jgi:nitroreductase
MDVLEAIRSRRSIGRSQGEVPTETIRELVEAATWAPNHKLTEPWRFTVLRGEARFELGKLWAERAAAEIASEQREKFIEGEARKPLRAPTLIVVSTRTDENPVRAEEDLTATAAAVQNLLLAAHAKGLGAAWKTGKMIYDPDVKRFLGLDPADRIVAVVYLGTEPREEAAPRPRDVDGVIRWVGDPVLTGRGV